MQVARQGGLLLGIDDITDNEGLTCIECGNPVLLKSGPVVPPYLAHMPGFGTYGHCVLGSKRGLLGESYKHAHGKVTIAKRLKVEPLYLRYSCRHRVCIPWLPEDVVSFEYLIGALRIDLANVTQRIAVEVCHTNPVSAAKKIELEELGWTLVEFRTKAIQDQQRELIYDVAKLCDPCAQIEQERLQERLQSAQERKALAMQYERERKALGSAFFAEHKRLINLANERIEKSMWLPLSEEYTPARGPLDCWPSRVSEDPTVFPLLGCFGEGPAA